MGTGGGEKGSALNNDLNAMYALVPTEQSFASIGPSSILCCVLRCCSLLLGFRVKPS